MHPRITLLQVDYQHISNLRFVRSDMTDLAEIPGNHFCGAIARCAIHMIQPAKWLDVVTSVDRVLHMGGVFWVVDSGDVVARLPVPEGRWERLSRTTSGWVSCVYRKVAV
jgi:ubiquinone/menaquinone biosynthesis C-methylase UbiE